MVGNWKWLLQEHKLTPAYDFHSYIRRTMEEDFRVVVGIRSVLKLKVSLFLHSVNLFASAVKSSHVRHVVCMWTLQSILLQVLM
jgi:hypothetical protein